MNKKQRIAITGLGAITPLGLTCQSTWDNCIAGRCGISTVKAWDTSNYKTNFAGEISDFNPLNHFSPEKARRLDRCNQLAIVAAREAVTDAGLHTDSIDTSRIGISVGTSLGGMISGQMYDRLLLTKEIRKPSYTYQYPIYVTLNEMTEAFGFLGPRSVISTACTASTIAIGQATEMIRSGKADCVLAGGVDPLAEFSFAGFNSMQNVSSQPCAPFSEPIGLNTGEGAAMLILERMDLALQRGATVYAELLGYALSADAFHQTSPDPSGRSQQRLLSEALTAGGVTKEEVDYINAHGTGTTGNDVTESRALEVFFGDTIAHIPVSSTKGALGHSLGATGAVEAVLTALAVHHGQLPPTVNFTSPRKGCALNYLPNTSQSKKVSVAVSQNFAFGGNNAALVFGHSERTATVQPKEYRAQQVVVTGLGLITPIGCGKDAFLASMQAGISGIGKIKRFTATGKAKIGAVLESFDPRTYSRAQTRKMDRLGQFTVCAAELACKDADIRVTRELSERMGLVLGSTLGPIESCKKFHREPALGIPHKANPSVFPNTVCNAAGGLAAIHLRLKGPNVMVMVGDASGLSAISYGYELIKNGAADVLICGGVEQLEPCSLDGYDAARLISPHRGKGGAEQSGPFGKSSNGMVLGEGAGFVVLESLDHARARKASIYGTITGYHSNADQPVTQGRDPEGSGMVRCMNTALEHAGISQAEIDYIAAAASSDPLIDRAEAMALLKLFKNSPPVGALASALGTSSATGSTSLCAVLLGMQSGFMPCSVSYTDSEYNLDIVSKTPRHDSIKAALINAMSLGGTNVSLVVNKDI